MAKSLIPVARLLRIPAHGNLEAMAEQRQWQKPVGQARGSAGFVRGALSKELVFPLGNGWSVMTVYLSSRALSAAAVNTALAEKIARILDEEQRKVGSKEKRQLKEDLVFSMLPSAPLVTKEISLFVNQEKNLLLLGSGSEVVADAVARLFHQEQDGELRMPAGLRILAVDDVPSNLELLQVHFARTACQFTAVGSGEEALRRCAHTPFDLVLMDLHMPGMDGLEAARSLRAQEHALQQPRSCIVALSASVLDEDRDNAFAAGMDGYAFKPIDWPRLAAEILRALQPGSTSAAPAPAAQPAQAAPSAAHDAANPPLPAIDWSHALALWGDAAPLHAALQRCLDDNTDIVAQWQGLHAQAQWPALAAGAHRLRGQAGNLGLLALQQCLGQLEQAARAGDAQACARHLGALPDLWQALRAAQSQLPAPALAAHPAPLHEPAPTAQLPALATPQHSQVLLALEDALLALEEGALPEPALLTLATLLPAAVLQPIQEAVERFDFPLAQQRLQALRHQL